MALCVRGHRRTVTGTCAAVEPIDVPSVPLSGVVQLWATPRMSRVRRNAARKGSGAPAPWPSAARGLDVAGAGECNLAVAGTSSQHGGFRARPCQGEPYLRPGPRKLSAIRWVLGEDWDFFDT